MKIVITSSEAVPFAKSGGLADVISALAAALANAGHRVSLILPRYRHFESQIPQLVEKFTPLPPEFEIPIGSRQVTAQIFRTQLPGSTVDVYLIDQPGYFDRPALYHDGQRDYRDNCERFVFLSRAAMEAVRLLELQPHILHAHDWQTGLVPAYLDIDYRHVPGFEQTASVFTVHNLVFQGQFWHWDMELTGLDWKYFNWRQMEFFGNLNLLKTGLVFADAITTVSPTYAREIQTAEFGCGLHGVLRARSEDLTGILNGVDTSIWNPATDPHLEQNYSAADFEAGKAACKAALQRRLGLEVRPDVPLAGMIARLTEQKGIDLVLARAESLIASGMQLAILGTGEARFETALKQLAAEHPESVSTTIGFDESLAHQMEAGCDLYLMPSRFEPCGLNQMYSLIYGTIPVVRAVGGLADTVTDTTPETLLQRTANGFVFNDYDPAAFEDAVQRCLKAYADPEVWRQLVTNAMRGDWSWSRSAAEYVRVYQRAIARHHNRTICSSSSG